MPLNQAVKNQNRTEPDNQILTVPMLERAPITMNLHEKTTQGTTVDQLTVGVVEMCVKVGTTIATEETETETEMDETMGMVEQTRRAEAIATATTVTVKVPSVKSGSESALL